MLKIKTPFYGTKIFTGFLLEKVLEYLHKKTLFYVRWQFNKKDEHTEPEKIYNKIVRTAVVKRLVELKAIWGIFKVKKNGQDLILYENDNITFTFKRQKKEPFLSLVDFFNDDDIIVFQIVTIGDGILKYSKELYDKGNFSDYFFYYNFGSELTEAFAEFFHNFICGELNIKDKKICKRFSPGYPAWPSLEDQAKIFNLLKPERININLSPNYQMIPEHSTDALLVFNENAKYFTI